MSARKYVLPAWEGPESPQTPVPVDERIEAAEAVALQAEHYVRDEVPELIAAAVADERQRILPLVHDLRNRLYELSTDGDERDNELRFDARIDLLDGAS